MARPPAWKGRPPQPRPTGGNMPPKPATPRPKAPTTVPKAPKPGGTPKPRPGGSPPRAA
jgi:hypothetical protein